MLKHFTGEVGSDVLLDTGIDMSTGVSLKQIRYKTPDGVATGTWNASLYSSYSELAEAIGTYFLKYTLAVGDLSQSGEWRFQAWIANSTGTWYGETAKEIIFGAFE